MKETKYTLFWLDGSTNAVHGFGVVDAMNKAGFGGGSIRALDFYCEGDNTDYEWKDGAWHRREVR